MKQFKHRLARLLALTLLVATHSITAADTQQYEIELLVFQHLVNSDAGEVWRAEYSDWPDDSLGGQDWINNATVEWLAATRYRLGPHQASLRSSAQYRPIAHLAWRQAVQDRQSARPLHLPVSQSSVDNTYVEGNVTVAVERYLHLSLDLTLHSATAAQDELLSDQPAPAFKLVEQRRMRSRELHYFDHPRFGVLALITPYDPGGQ